MNQIKLLFITILLICTSKICHANDPLVIIVNIDNKHDTLTKKQLIDLYLGRYVAFPDGTTAVPLDREKSASIRKDFFEALTEKPMSQINAYWSRIKFTGRVSPPQVVSDDQAVIDAVSKQVDAIGYIPLSKINNKVKVVYKIAK
ncbi:type 2 periplasmic-binding domain-containing protein [Flocculibacter collagenilyticus]|uniref:hypothetical protein n=1 Tax=Flocculibacter collagenilyticus TaxID=2744479 RepID=UPI0018F5B468|nr:hypothetical protein [Flocculibacter collagenilyticus]